MGYTVTIVGAAGKMGKWFFDYFNSLKNNIYPPDINCDLTIDKILLYDIREIDYKLKYDNGIIYITNNVYESIKISDIIVFCIPISEIISMINSNITLFKPQSIIIEISSIKTQIYDILSNISINENIITLCIHPMFGPGASIFSSNKIIFIPVNKNKSKIEENLFNRIFPFCEKIIIEDPEKHDLAIAVIISLIYFINLVFSKFLLDFYEAKNESPYGIYGSIFKIQSLLTESILTDDISLFLSLFINNDKSVYIINRYGQLFNQLLDKIEKRDENFIKKYIKSTKKKNLKNDDINKSYDRLYYSIFKKQPIIRSGMYPKMPVISLIYFISLVFSKFLLELSTTKEFKFEDNLLHFFKKISGSTFKIQSLLSESILTDDISLFLSLFINNDKSVNAIDKYGQLFNQLLDKIEKRDENFIKKYIKSTKDCISKYVDINESYDMLYKFLNN